MHFFLTNQVVELYWSRIVTLFNRSSTIEYWHSYINLTKLLENILTSISLKKIFYQNIEIYLMESLIKLVWCSDVGAIFL